MIKILKVKDIISWRLSKLKPHGSGTGIKERVSV